MSEQRRLIGPGETWAIITALSYTTVNVLLRAAAVEIDPWLGSMLRQVPVALLAWFAVLWIDRGAISPSSDRFLGWPTLAGLVFAGFTSFVVGNVLFFGALANGGLGVAAAGAQGGVVVAGALGSVLLRERPSRQAWTGITLVVIGLYFIATAQGGGGPWLFGLLLAVGAGGAYAISNLVTRTVQRRRAALWVTLAANSLGGLGVLLVIQLVRGGGNPIAGADAAQVWIVLLAGCVNALALIGIAQSLRHISVAASSAIQTATVVFSFLAAIFIFAEYATPPVVVGVTAVAAGILVASLRRRASPADATPPSAES